MNDYWNMFCGKGKDCYKILGLTRVSRVLVAALLVLICDGWQGRRVYEH